MNFEKSYGVVDPMRLAKWFDHEDGGSFLIAPMNNPKQIEENIKLMKVGDTEAVEPESLYDAKKTSCDILAKSMLMDWKEVTVTVTTTNEEGEEVSKEEVVNYTPEMGADILYKHNEFRTWIVDHATDLTTKNDEKKEAIVKN